MKYSFTHLLLVLCLGLGHVIFADDLIRTYNPETDYSAASALCGQYWQVLGEGDEMCSHTFENYLYALALPENNPDIYLKARVLLINNEVIGICIYQLPLANTDATYGELSYIIIDPKYQRNGYGALLFKAVKEDLNKSGLLSITARVHATNDLALAWHKKQGFVVVKPEQNLHPHEEIQLIGAGSYGYTLLKLSLSTSNDEPSVKPISSKALGDLKRKVEKEAKIGKQQLTIHTSLIARIVTLMKPRMVLSHSQLFKIVRYYINSFKDVNETIKFASYLIKTKFDHTSLELTGFLGFVENYIDLVNELGKENAHGTFKNTLDEADAICNRLISRVKTKDIY